jgi:hypothetical protein
MSFEEQIYANHLSSALDHVKKAFDVLMTSGRKSGTFEDKLKDLTNLAAAHTALSKTLQGSQQRLALANNERLGRRSRP